MRLLDTDLPAPEIAVLQTLALWRPVFRDRLGEELGWSGYAIDLMQQRWGALRASLLLGSVWASWHFVALAQLGRSLEWIAWWSLWSVAARVIIVWFYNRAGGSVFGAAVYHASSNVAWQIFPAHGSYFKPRGMRAWVASKPADRTKACGPPSVGEPNRPEGARFVVALPIDGFWSKCRVSDWCTSLTMKQECGMR